MKLKRRFSRDLQEQTRALARKREQLIEELRAGGAGPFGLGFPGDLADMASQENEWQLDTALRAGLAEEFEEVEEALQRVRDGEYGYCENCHRPIRLSRLRALPQAILCIRCKRQEETAPEQHGDTVDTRWEGVESFYGALDRFEGEE